jgi:glycerophosphoryl diester phosphodiesterase
VSAAGRDGSRLAPLLSLTRVAVIAHRGGSKLNPENTMPAFEHADRLGVDGIECDVHLSRDGEPVVIHDATLDRTTDASGPVAALTADELARVDAGHRFDEAAGFPYRGRGAGVPRLATLLRRLPDLPFVVELKGDDARIVAPVLDLIRELGALDRVILGGFSQVVLDEARRLAPQVPTSASRDEVRAAVRRAAVWLGPARSGFALIQAPMRFQGREVFGRRFVRVVRRRGFPVHAWIVDDEAEMRRLVDWGVTGLISDRPDVAMNVARALR